MNETTTKNHLNLNLVDIIIFDWFDIKVMNMVN